MCNRYVAPDQAAIERAWHIGRHNPWRGEVAIFPRSQGPFLRALTGADALELVVGQWGLIPGFAKSRDLKYATNNARSEELPQKASYKLAWARGQRCIIPAVHFDEPCWESGKNVWWNFRRKDGGLWALAGIWNTWTDRDTGEIVESYSMLTVNADHCPLMSRMHKPDPKVPADRQDKRSVIPIADADVAKWLTAPTSDVLALLRPAPADLFDAGPRTI